MMSGVQKWSSGNTLKNQGYIHKALLMDLYVTDNDCLLRLLIAVKAS